MNLNLIEARAEAATGPCHAADRGIGWEVHAGTGTAAGQSCFSPLTSAKDCTGPINNGERETLSKADAEFLAMARADVLLLAASVRQSSTRFQKIQRLALQIRRDYDFSDTQSELLAEIEEAAAGSL